MSTSAYTEFTHISGHTAASTYSPNTINDVTFNICFSAADHTRHNLYVEMITLACGTGYANIYDGSTGNQIVGLYCTSGGNMSHTWDFRDDPLRTLGTDTTDSLCISSTAPLSCFISGYWGPK